MMAGSIARVFPRRTAATPTDALAYTGEPPLFGLEGITEVHVSVAFTYDLPRAEWLARSWARTGLPVTIGGPATGAAGGDFVPGRYLRDGYVITSRGCPNRCWFCSVWRREGAELRELPITDGYNVLDDNLLACSDDHVRAVFAMLARQGRPPEFTGGLEAARLQEWHAVALRALRPEQVFFAYDTPDDLCPLRYAGELLYRAGFRETTKALRAYVLCGFPRDTLADAELRMREARAAGFYPMAMLYRDQHGRRQGVEWQQFARQWTRPALMWAAEREEKAACPA